MSLLDTIRAAVKTVDTVTKALQATVLHEVYLGDSGVGDVKYAPAVKRLAIVDKKQRQIKSSTGVLVMSSATVTILDPKVVMNEKDRIFLPDGTGGEIGNIGGFVDAGTKHPAFNEIYLG